MRQVIAREGGKKCPKSNYVIVIIMIGTQKIRKNIVSFINNFLCFLLFYVENIEYPVGATVSGVIIDEGEV